MFDVEFLNGGEDYLRGAHELGDETRDVILDRLIQHVGSLAPDWLADPANRVGPYLYDLYLVFDRGRTVALRLFIDDSHAAVGVMRVVYVDATSTQTPHWA